MFVLNFSHVLWLSYWPPPPINSLRVYLLLTSYSIAASLYPSVKYQCTTRQINNAREDQRGPMYIHLI
jgi:hypothetical protein